MLTPPFLSTPSQFSWFSFHMKNIFVFPFLSLDIDSCAHCPTSLSPGLHSTLGVCWDRSHSFWPCRVHGVDVLWFTPPVPSWWNLSCFVFCCFQSLRTGSLSVAFPMGLLGWSPAGRVAGLRSMVMSLCWCCLSSLLNACTVGKLPVASQRSQPLNEGCGDGEANPWTGCGEGEVRGKTNLGTLLSEALRHWGARNRSVSFWLVSTVLWFKLLQ